MTIGCRAAAGGQDFPNMTRYRIEKDLLGEREVPADAMYGVHTLRSVENFPLSRRPVNPALIHAFGAVKLACARTNHELGWWDGAKANAIEQACTEMMEGMLDTHVVTDALQGGAGTSTNMNVNEVLANRALQLLGKPLGDYAAVGPLEDINLHQSTNDTYPTALKVAAIQQLRVLQREVVALLEEFQAKEKAFAHIVKIGRTQLQDAVLVTLGREMSAYAEAFGRDRWLIYKCEERLRVVNCLPETTQGARHKRRQILNVPTQGRCHKPQYQLGKIIRSNMRLNPCVHRDVKVTLCLG